MPSQKNRKGKAKHNADVTLFHSINDAALDELVAAIEGKCVKQGSTKSQMNGLVQKSISSAIEKAQQDPSPPYSFAAAGPKGNNEVAKGEWAHDVEELATPTLKRDEYVNKEVLLPKEYCGWRELAPRKYVRYEQFKGTDEEMEFIVNFFSEMLTEPYSSFTYQYFVFGWPDLCITAYGVESDTMPDSTVIGERMGAIVSRVTRYGPMKPLRGYVAMFAVAKHYRGFRLGTHLVSLTVKLMKAKDCDEVYLETPLSSRRALDLYDNLGFTKTKFLPRYYLDRSDAVRMVLWLKNALPEQEEGLPNGQSSILDTPTASSSV